MDSIRNKMAALLLALGMLGGSAFAVEAATGPSSLSSFHAIQATPDASPAATDTTCLDEQDEEAGEEDEANGDDKEGAREENEAENDTEDDGGDEQDDNGTGQESAPATPGTLTEGQDLMPGAKITVEQAITTAQGAATGSLGTVELEERAGTLVFEVTIGEQEVFVDATTGTVASVEPVKNTGNDCEDDAAVAPGTLTEGQDLLPQAKITVEQAITTAQGSATGNLGEVELEQNGGTLVFTVDIGEQEVMVDAATGQLLSVDQDN